jgi:hypothetical protein
MKTVWIILVVFFISSTSYAQETVAGKVLKNVKTKTYQRGEQKGEQGTDGVLDKAEDKIKNIFKKKDKNKKSEAETKETEDAEKEENQNQKSSGKTSKKPVKTNSKFDFIAGDKVLGVDDFSTTNVGDFPLGWNTNSSAEIVTLDESDQKWLSITKDGYFQPEFIKDMPDNFTLEFDIFTRYRSSNILEY